MILEHSNPLLIAQNSIPAQKYQKLLNQAQICAGEWVATLDQSRGNQIFNNKLGTLNNDDVLHTYEREVQGWDPRAADCGHQSKYTRLIRSRSLKRWLAYKTIKQWVSLHDKDYHHKKWKLLTCRNIITSRKERSWFRVDYLFLIYSN